MAITTVGTDGESFSELRVRLHAARAMSSAMITVARAHRSVGAKLRNDIYRRRERRIKGPQAPAAGLRVERGTGNRAAVPASPPVGASPGGPAGDRDHLRRQLASLPVIEQAKGMIMAERGVSGDEAFRLLRRQSQRTNTKLADVAAAIVRRERPLSRAPMN